MPFRAHIEAAEKLGRIAVAATTLRLEPAPLVEALSYVDEESLRHAFLGIDHAFTRLSARVRWPTRDETREKLLAYHSSTFPQQAQRVAGLLHRGHRLVIEWSMEADGTLGCSIHSHGSEPVATDTATLVGLSGADPSVGESMQIVTHPLAGLAPVSAEACDGISDRWRASGSRWDFRFVVVATTPEELARHTGTLDAVASGLAVTEAQRRFLLSSHPTLGRGRNVIATVSMTSSGHVPRLGIEYSPMSWDSAVRILEGFHPGTEAAEHLGGFAGAVGGEEAATVEIELGPDEPPGVMVWSELTAKSPVAA